MSPTRFATLAIATLAVSTSLLAEARCSLPHYPVAVGDVNEYRMTSTQFDADGNAVNTTSSTYAEEVTAVERDHYQTKTTTEGNATESKWLCNADGLSVELAEMPGMTIATTGVSIPSKMAVGDSWTQTFEMSGEGFTQKMNTVNRVTRREDVTVEAGTWAALRVDYEIETIVPDQPTVVIRGTQWFAPGVGLVKSTSTVPMEGEIRSVESTIDLVRRSAR